MGAVSEITGLPSNFVTVLNATLDALQTAYGPDLRSVILYGSAAEGKLRPSSDVNLLILLSKFEQSSTDKIREQMRTAEAAIRLRTMFVLEAELSDVAEAFAQKFADIKRRHRVLLGSDLVADLEIGREAEIARLRQVLLNLQLRLRNIYVSRGQRPEQLAESIAEISGPLRTCAASLLELQGHPATSPKQALIEVGTNFRSTLENLSALREKRVLERDEINKTAFSLVQLIEELRNLAKGLR